MYSLNLKQKRIIAIVGIIVLVLIIIYFYNSRLETPQLEDDILIEENQTNSNLGNKTEEKDLIIIHITGAVKMPGIVKLEEGARIEDAIKLAEGLTENADISNVNLAYVLEDGVKIVIPSKGEGQNEAQKIIDEEAGDNIIVKDAKKVVKCILKFLTFLSPKFTKFPNHEIALSPSGSNLEFIFFIPL